MIGKVTSSVFQKFSCEEKCKVKGGGVVLYSSSRIQQQQVMIL